MREIKAGVSIYCWPDRHDAPDREHPYYLESAIDVPMLQCHGVITGVASDHIAVHYYLPDGANGSCQMSLAPASGPERGKWWWPGV